MNQNEVLLQGWNRLWLCVICVLLLWITTLETAMKLSREFLVPPHIDLVIETCSEQYAQVDQQRHDYEQCVNNQIKVCDRDLDSGILSELHRSGNASNNNQEILAQISETSNAAKLALEQIKISIGNYLHVSER